MFYYLLVGQSEKEMEIAEESDGVNLKRRRNDEDDDKNLLTDEENDFMNFMRTLYADVPRQHFEMTIMTPNENVEETSQKVMVNSAPSTTNAIIREAVFR